MKYEAPNVVKLGEVEKLTFSRIIGLHHDAEGGWRWFNPPT